MFKSLKTGHAFQKRVLVRISIIIFVMALVSAHGLVKNGIADSGSEGSGMLCGYDSLCNTPVDKEFEMILYSAAGSEMVVLYSKNEIGDIVPEVPKSYYHRAKGTVEDAIYYLSRNYDYTGFKFRRAKKSTGVFRTEIIKGVYVAVPKYRLPSDHRPPEYRIADKNGKLTVSIKPFIRSSN